MSKEIVILTSDGEIGTEMIGFEGKSCFKVAAKVVKELERLGIEVSVNDIRMKDNIDQLVTKAKKQSQTIERG